METNKNVLSSALSAAVVIAMAVILVFLLWISGHEPVNTPSSLSLVAHVIPAYTDESGVVRAAKYTASVFDTNYVSAAGRLFNTVNISAGDNSDMIAAAGNSRPVAAPAQEIPDQYTEIKYPYLDFPVYVYMNSEGKAQYRVYLERLSNGSTESGFVKASQSIRNMKISMDYDTGDMFIRTADEDFGTIIQVNAPADLQGDLIKEFSAVGTYYLINASGNMEYYVYGHYPNSTTDDFYLADNNGIMIPGTLPVSIN